MRDYEQKQVDKKERLHKAAARRREQSATFYTDAKQMFEAIPFCQPILVGHYSEKRDRAFRARANGKMAKSIQLSKEADRLDERADGVGSGGISSDDPEALPKLEAKLLEAQEAHALMVERNREARANGQDKPYRTWELSNSRGRITSIKDRVTALERVTNSQTMAPIAGAGWKIYENKENARIAIKFDERPSAEICKSLRSFGFLWSPTRAEWVRKSINARYAVDRATELLQDMKSSS